MTRINPFKPNFPFPPGIFVGRGKEIERLEQHLEQTKAGSPASFAVIGERGVGKSSLLNYLGYLARGKIKTPDQELHRFLVISTDVDRRTTQLALAGKIEMGITQELAESEAAREFVKKTWSFLQRVEAGGVKLRKEAEPEEESALIEEFAYSLATTANRLCASDDSLFGASYVGILILIDECDNSSEELALGAFLKLLSERLQRRGCEKVMFGLAGLPALLEVLRSSHESSVRVVDPIPLEQLSRKEIDAVIDMVLLESRRLNNTDLKISQQARDLLATLSEGYPHFLQQFGYCAFAADKDNSIDDADVQLGAYGDGGAIQALGERYYRNDYYNKIKEDNYRKVLDIMAAHGDQWVTKKAIKTKFGGSDSILSNALKALRDRNIIVSKEGAMGTYRLQQRSFGLWIKLEASRRQQGKG